MHALITGGAGFIGSNLAQRLLGDGHSVTVFDNLSRRGTERNLEWLQSLGSDRLTFVRGDIRDYDALCKVVGGKDAVFHLAAQVAVTTSVTDPRNDFEINALGTFNLVEAVRTHGSNPAVVFASTNKVYGGMEDVEVEHVGQQYRYKGLPHGVSEERGLDFHSPYGCSKGAADQYVHDYSRIYGLRSVVLRMSCIYGTRQFGNEDQGWVAHFCIQAALGRPISIYGDGYQVRDVLFVQDVIDAYLESVKRVDQVGGQIFNIGGGPGNVISLRDLIDTLQNKLDRKIPTTFGDWRPGDQKVYVSDIRKAERLLGWRPRVSWNEGVSKLLTWIDANRTMVGG